jgi:nucleotide-binding universal stress UspA family protein
MYKNILVMTDFSQDSFNAVEKAASLAHQYRARLSILHVAQDQSQLCLWINNGDYKQIKESIDREIECEFEKLQKNIPLLQEVNLRKIIRRGIPYIEGLEELQKHSYDLVIIGSHGKNKVDKFLTGSTAAKITRHACIDVLITRLQN